MNVQFDHVQCTIYFPHLFSIRDVRKKQFNR